MIRSCWRKRWSASSQCAPQIMEATPPTCAWTRGTTIPPVVGPSRTMAMFRTSGALARKKAGARRSETLSGATVGGGTDAGLAVQVPGNTGALRQESIELSGTAATGLRITLVSPTVATAVLR